MSKGPVVLKFCCLLPFAEATGVVKTPPHPIRSAFDLELDPNYRHMILPPPSRQTLLFELYDTRDQAGCPEISGPPNLESELAGKLPLVTANGDTRAIQEGDHIRIVGAWVTDNVAHEDEIGPNPALEFFERGPWWFGFPLLKVWFVKSEVHPYIGDTVQLIQPLQEGGVAEETLSLCAPLFTQAYGNFQALSNWLYGYAAKEDWQRVRLESIRDVVSASWLILAPPLPAGAIVNRTHRLDYTVEITQQPSPDRIIRHETRPEPEGLRVEVSIGKSGFTDVRNPARFQAKYLVRWEALEPAKPVLQVQVELDPDVDEGASTVTVRAFDPSGQPVEGAEVRINGVFKGETLVSFPFTLKRNHAYLIAVSKDGYLTGTSDIGELSDIEPGGDIP